MIAQLCPLLAREDHPLAHTTPQDFRSFLAAIGESGDLVAIDHEVDWDQELSGIGRLSCERNGPAFLFNNIKDYHDAPRWRLATNPIATWRRMAVAFGLPADAPVPALYATYAAREAKPVPPVIVKDGPCKEVVIDGARVDLFDLPVPMVHEGDGGRYIGTWDLVVSRDAKSEWVNWGMYRFMVHNERLMTGFPRPTSHLGKMLLDGYVPAGRPMPIAIAMGCDPLCHLAAAATFRIGGNEADLAGGLRERAVELVKCETSDLYVPASAEVVIEAEVYPDRVNQEGPYGEYPGYRSGEMGNAICARVTAITHRRDPIWTLDTTGFMDSSATSTSGSRSRSERQLASGTDQGTLRVIPGKCRIRRRYCRSVSRRMPRNSMNLRNRAWRFVRESRAVPRVRREVTTASQILYALLRASCLPTDYTGGCSAATDGMPKSPDPLIGGDDPLVRRAAVRRVTQPFDEAGDLNQPAEPGQHVQVRARVPAQHQEEQVGRCVICRSERDAPERASKSDDRV